MSNASALLKFAGQQESRGQRLHWHRAGADGVPFRGNEVPLLSEAEYDQRVVRSLEFKNGFFDVTNEKENAAYCDVMDKIANKWFQLRHQVFFVNGTTRHYVEWLEHYMEDGTPVLSH